LDKPVGVKSAVLDRRNLVFISSIILVSGLAVGLVLYTTVWGAGLISDSFQYISSARNIAAGREFGYINAGRENVPLTQYPPFFSVVLSVFEILGLNSMDGVRFLNAALFGINAILVGISIHKISASWGFALLGSLLTALSSTLIEAHSWALSEPLYFCLSLAALLSLAEYLQGSGRGWLLVASILLGLGFLTRYAGLSLVVCALCILVLNRSLKIGEKLASGSILAAISILPMGLWTVRNYALTGTLNNRSFSSTPITPKNLLSAADTFLGWLFPSPVVNGHEKLIVVLGVALVAILALAYLIFLKKNPYAAKLVPGLNARGDLFKAHFLYVGLYFGTVLVSKAYFDDNIGFSERIFSPMLVSGLILLCACLARLWQAETPLFKVGVALCSVYMVSYYAAGAAHLAPRLHEKGIGVARKSWHNAASIQMLPAYSSAPVYSNSPSTLYLWTGNVGYSIGDFEAFLEQGKQQEAVLVIFHHIASNRRIERLSQGLKILADDRAATVYLYSPLR
jgi:hypothetical protein